MLYPRPNLDGCKDPKRSALVRRRSFIIRVCCAATVLFGRSTDGFALQTYSSGTNINKRPEISEIEARLNKIFRKCFYVDQKKIVPDARLVEDLWISPETTGIVIVAEFDIPVTEDEVAHIRTFRELVDYVHQNAAAPIRRDEADEFCDEEIPNSPPSHCDEAKPTYSKGGKGPSNYRFSHDHVWAYLESDVCFVGISECFANSLGDIVYFELPKIGSNVAAGERFGSVESVKAVSNLYSPLDGKVIAINECLSASPGSVNEKPYLVWILKISLSDAKQMKTLMTTFQYDKLVRKEQGK